MSHLTLAGRKCKVGDKRSKCVFHSRRTGSRPFTRGSKSEDQLLDEAFERRFPGRYPGAMGTPRGRKLNKNRSVEDIHTGRRKYTKDLQRYIPRFDSIRTGARATSRSGGSSRKGTTTGRAWWKRALDEIPGPTGRRAGDWQAVIEDFMTYAGFR